MQPLWGIYDGTFVHDMVSDKDTANAMVGPGGQFAGQTVVEVTSIVGNPPYMYNAATMTAWPGIVQYQANAIATINAKTQSLLVSPGYTYSGNGKSYAVDNNSMFEYIEIQLGTANSLVTFPQSVQAIDGTVTSAQNQATVNSFVGGAITRRRTVIQGGMTLIAAVLADTTMAQVDATVASDNRT